MICGFTNGDRVRHVRSGEQGEIVEHISPHWVIWRPDDFDGPADGAICTDPANLDRVRPVTIERRFDLDNLVSETIAAVERTAHGTRIRCASGAAVIIERGHIFDPAGNPVIEP